MALVVGAERNYCIENTNYWATYSNNIKLLLSIYIFQSYIIMLTLL